MGRRRLPLLLMAGAAAGAVAVLRHRARRPRRMHPVLQGRPLLIAHRGGAQLAPENTMAAFRLAIESWHADMLELDVHASADGRCVVIHDSTVDRTTNGTGQVARLPYDVLAGLDAGHDFTPDGGRTHPFRGQGVRIPVIEDVLAAWPDARLTVEVKAEAAQAPLFDAIRRFGASHRVIAASMHEAERTMFAEYAGAISASTEEMRRFIGLRRMGVGPLVRMHADVVQVPEMHEDVRIVTPSLIRALHEQGVPIHVWTVNDESDMHRLLDWGVDGVLSDRPDVLGRVLHDRTGRPLAPGHAPVLGSVRD